MTPDSLKILKDILLQQREQIKESIVNNITSTNIDLVEKGKAQMCNILLSKIEETKKERQVIEDDERSKRE